MCPDIGEWWRIFIHSWMCSIIKGDRSRICCKSWLPGEMTTKVARCWLQTMSCASWQWLFAFSRNWFALRNTTSWSLALLWSLYFRRLPWVQGLHVCLAPFFAQTHKLRASVICKFLKVVSNIRFAVHMLLRIPWQKEVFFLKISNVLGVSFFRQLQLWMCGGHIFHFLTDVGIFLWR